MVKTKAMLLLILIALVSLVTSQYLPQQYIPMQYWPMYGPLPNPMAPNVFRPNPFFNPMFSRQMSFVARSHCVCEFLDGPRATFRWLPFLSYFNRLCKSALFFLTENPDEGSLTRDSATSADTSRAANSNDRVLGSRLRKFRERMNLRKKALEEEAKAAVKSEPSLQKRLSRKIR